MIEKGKVLFDESNLPYIIHKKKELWHSKEIRAMNRYIYFLFIIPIFSISILFFFLYFDTFSVTSKIINLSFIFIIISYSIIDLIISTDAKKDLIIYENGIVIPIKPISYVLRHKSWFVPFSIIESIAKEEDDLVVKFKNKYSRDRYIPIDYISDWSKFKAPLKGKVELNL